MNMKHTKGWTMAMDWGEAKIDTKTHSLLLPQVKRALNLNSKSQLKGTAEGRGDDDDVEADSDHDGGESEKANNKS